MSPYTPVNWSEHDDEGARQASRGTAARAMYDHDAPCTTCGYNLRGLPFGNKCPECGADRLAGSEYSELNINAPRLRALVDIMLVGGPEARHKWTFGLLLALLCLVGVVVSRLFYFAGGVTGTPFEKEYLVFGAVNSMVWACAVWMILPARIGRQWPRMRTFRYAVLLTQMLWIPAYLIWMLRVFDTTANSDLLIAGHLLLRAIAGIGFIALGQLLVFICEEAELQHVAKRFNAASWMIAIPTLLGQLFVGSLPWIVVVLNFLVLLWWVWCLGLYVLGFLAMRQHVSWGQRHRVEGVGRAHRIAEKKKAHEQMVEQQIRPLPIDTAGDEPLAL